MVDTGRRQASRPFAAPAGPAGTLARVAEPTSAAAAPERRHLGGGAIASTASQMVVLVAGAITSIAIARAIGPAGNGSFALAANLFAVALLVAGIGIKQGIVVLTGSGRWQPGEVVRDLAAPLAVLGLGGAALVLGAYELGRDHFLDGLPSAAVPALVAAVPFGIAWQWSWSLALGRERYEAYAVMQALPMLLTMVIAVTLAIASGTTAAVIGFAVAQIIAGAAGAAWALRLRGDPESTERRRTRRERLRAVYRFGLLSWASELLQFVNFRFDLFFLSAFAITADVGIYSVAATATAIALILPQSLSVAVMPRTAALEGASSRGETDIEQADISDARASRHTLLLLPVSGFFVAILIVAIPLIYGSKFDDAVKLGFILLPGTLALGLGKVFTSVTLGRGYPRYALYTVLVTVPLTIAGYLLVIPDEGATGAAIVSTCSYSLTAALSFFWFRRVTGIPARSALVPRAEDLHAYPEVAALSIDYVRPLAGAIRSRLRRRHGGEGEDDGG